MIDAGVCSAGLRTTRCRGQGRRQLPRRHQEREVPRDDLSDDAERLVEVVGDRVVVEFGDRALLPAQNACEVPEVVDRQRDVRGQGLPDRLAVFPALGHGDRLEFSSMRRAILVRMSERSPATSCPRRGRGACGVERQFDVLGGAARDLAERLAVDRRHVLEVLALHRGDPLAADQLSYRAS